MVASWNLAADGKLGWIASAKASNCARVMTVLHAAPVARLAAVAPVLGRAEAASQRPIIVITGVSGAREDVFGRRTAEAALTDVGSGFGAGVAVVLAGACANVRDATNRTGMQTKRMVGFS